METIYKFTSAELAGIKKRRDEVIKFLSTIAEIRELPDGLEVNADSTGFVLHRNGTNSTVNEQKAKE